MSRARILLVGGAGVFGSRLALGLAATVDADVLIAGRDLAKAQKAARDTGSAGALSLDRASAKVANIAALNVRLVIDAAGPFQGADLSFARACIAAGADYIDLADARDFVDAFPSLDAEARAKGVHAITGASSTPAITHAVLDVLTAGWTRIDSVHAGISAGNRAPRGRSVIEAILAWVGAPVRVFTDGRWQEKPGWSGTTRRRVADTGRRRFALAETPDLDLVPKRFAAREDAVFTAGLELGVLHGGTALIGRLRRLGIIRDPRPMAGMLQRMATLVHTFGSDRGCMFVEAIGRDANNRPTRAEWTLAAPAVEGPFTPTLPALALARKLIAGEPVEPGARPCVGILSLADLEGDFARHGLNTEIVRERLTGPFEMALGADFARLPTAVQSSHSQGPVMRFSGTARVEGATPLGWLVARVFGFPRKADAAKVAVKKTIVSPGREIWERTIGGSRFRSDIRFDGPGRVTERFGPFIFTLALGADETRHVMRIAGWRLGWLPMPGFLAPRSIAIESVSEHGLFTFDVPIAAPLLGRLTRYKGELRNTNIEERAT